MEQHKRGAEGQKYEKGAVFLSYQWQGVPFSKMQNFVTCHNYIHVLLDQTRKILLF